MNYLLDTNVLVYILSNPQGLSKRALDVVLHERNLFVSVVSLWEIGIKQSIEKLGISLSVPEIENICKERDISVISITSEEIERIKILPKIHNDPFDRLIIAQSQVNDFTIVTSDKTIPQYDVKTVW